MTFADLTNITCNDSFYDQVQTIWIVLQHVVGNNMEIQCYSKFPFDIYNMKLQILV